MCVCAYAGIVIENSIAKPFIHPHTLRLFIQPRCAGIEGPQYVCGRNCPVIERAQVAVDEIVTVRAVGQSNKLTDDKRGGDGTGEWRTYRPPARLVKPQRSRPLAASSR